MIPLVEPPENELFLDLLRLRFGQPRVNLRVSRIHLRADDGTDHGWAGDSREDISDIKAWAQELTEQGVIPVIWLAYVPRRDVWIGSTLGPAGEMVPLADCRALERFCVQGNDKTSFEQALEALLDLPLGNAAPRSSNDDTGRDMSTRSISIHFEVPADLDTPSEVLASAKELLLEALNQHAQNENYDFTDEQRAIMAALLTES
jgi:hypothetical protein